MDLFCQLRRLHGHLVPQTLAQGAYKVWVYGALSRGHRLATSSSTQLLFALGSLVQGFI